MTGELTDEEKAKLEEAEKIKKAVGEVPKKKKAPEPIVGCSRPPMAE